MLAAHSRSSTRISVPIVPDWVRQFSPRRIAAEEIGVIKKNLISFSMGSDLRMTVQSGIRLPPYLETEKRGVNVAWDKLAKVLFQFSYASGIMAKWVAKHLISICLFYIPMAHVIDAAAGHLTPMYPAYRKDEDILASHRLMAKIRSFMVSSAGYDEKKCLKEAIAKVQKATRAASSRSQP